jgi:nucleotide-binding universal stress UspA family protein
MIKTILVQLTGDRSDESTLETAYLVARLFDAHLECLHICTDWRAIATRSAVHDISGPIVSEEFFASFEWETEATRWRARLHLVEFCKRRQLSVSYPRPLSGRVSVTWREISGDPWLTTTQEARFYDIVVSARRDGIDDLGSLILNAGRPVLLAPHQTPENLAPTIAIAWKETAEAARAIIAAMPLLAKADRIHVLSVEDGGGSAATMESAEREAKQLRWHGLDTEAHYVISDDYTVAGAIVKSARDNRADLIVSGSYGHSRLSELVLGGVTRDLLRESLLPVFLFH